jgi:DICT domain-containing protein
MTADLHLPGLTIGDVSTRTGVSVPTLRSWEQRYGFPIPTRLISGHRRYRVEDISIIEQVQQQRAAGLSLPAALAQARRAVVTSAPSIFAGLRERHADLVIHVLGKRAMYAISRAIEDECLASGDAPVLIGSFQRERFYRESERRWRNLARTATTAIALAEFESEHRRAGQPLEIVVPPESALVREWAIVCDTPHAAAVLAGWEQPRLGRVSDRRRRFEAIWSTDADIVREATRIGLALAGEHTSRPLPVTVDDLPPVRDDPHGAVRRTTALTNRIVASIA